MRNPGFEAVQDGAIATWDNTPLAAATATDVVHTGTRSLRLSSTAPDFTPIATQNITKFEHNQKYRLKYVARADKMGQEYRVYVGAWKGTEWVTGYDTNWRQGMEAWQQVAVDFTVAPPVDRLQVVVQIKGPATIWFDDISLAPAPQETLPPALSAYTGSSKFVQIAPDRTLRVQDKPFFPIKIWGWRADSEEAMAKAADFGFNTIATTHMDSIGAPAMRLWLDTARKYGLMVIPASRVELASNQVETILPGKLKRLGDVVQKVRDHPALLAYNLADEPAWGGYDLPAMAQGAQLIRSLDPNHPIYINHAPRNTIEELRRYNRYVDISGSDIYPVWKTGIDRHSDLSNKTIGVVGDETIKNLTAVDNRKPVMQTLQAFSWSDNTSNPDLQDEPFPTHQQLRFMGYLSIVSGATGVAYYQDSRYPTLRPELKPIIREFAALQDVLSGGELLPSGGVANVPHIKVLAKSWKGSRVLLAVNDSNQDATVRLNWGALSVGDEKAVSSLKVMFENRVVSLTGGSLTDSFAPYAVHVYTDAPDEKAVLRAFVPRKVTATTDNRTDLRARFDAMVPRAGRRNVALAANGVKVTASSQLGAMVASHVNNGDRWGGQWNDATPHAYPDWVALEFPKPVAMWQIAIYSSDLQILGASSSDGIRDYTIQIEENGQWKTIRTVRNHDSVVSIVDLPKPVTAKRLMVLVTATSGAGDYTRIREIEVYEKPPAK